MDLVQLKNPQQKNPQGMIEQQQEAILPSIEDVVNIEKLGTIHNL